ncbi:uncharacterized protein DEA37_0003529, partial [Paragonimus westermani]
TPILPPTIVDQIHLWELERDRFVFQEGCLYEQFSKSTDFEVVRDYAKPFYVMLPSNDPSHISPVFIPRSFRSMLLLNSGVSIMVQPSILTTLSRLKYPGGAQPTHDLKSSQRTRNVGNVLQLSYLLNISITVVIA